MQGSFGGKRRGIGTLGQEKGLTEVRGKRVLVGGVKHRFGKNNIVQPSRSWGSSQKEIRDTKGTVVKSGAMTFYQGSVRTLGGTHPS